MASISSLSFLCNKTCRIFSLSSQLALRRHSWLTPTAKSWSQAQDCADPYSSESLRKPVVLPATAKSWSQAQDCADPYSSESLRKPVVLPAINSPDEDDKASGEDGNEWVDWEDQILEDTVPLSGFVRMILHSGRYNVGDRLNPHHETMILDKLLPYHPEYEEKIGTGVEYIKVDYHPNFEDSRCLFVVQEDGTLVDFSYWKCLKGLIRKKYPLYAESFILRHFPRPQHSD